MKICITGNCQATPLSELFKQLDEVEKLNTFTLHLSNIDKEKEDICLLDDCDLIIAQKTDSAFKPIHLNSDWLIDKYKDKVITWPNIFFNGQQPFIRYITSSKGRLKGPLDDYHDLRILLEWLKNSNYLKDDKIFYFSKNYIQENSLNSLKFLKEKESGCDIHTADIIEKFIDDKKLFFSFNHPTSFLLKLVFQRILEKISIKFSGFLVPDISNILFKKEEPLSTYTMPSDWPNSSDNHFYRGLDMNEINQRRKFIKYSLEELKNTFFSFYRDNFFDQVDLETIRLTPVMKNDKNIVKSIRNIKIN